jgi:hypothetical protein
MYEINARATLRAFICKLSKNGQTKTANGKANLYAGHTRLALQLRADGSSRTIVLAYKRIRTAIQRTYYARTVTRRDVADLASGKESALLGVLIEIFGDLGKVARTATGLVRLTLRGIRYFFAGVDRAVRDLEVAAANGARFVLMSYAHIRSRQAWKQHVQRLGLKVMLDSGAFTVWQAQQKGKAVEAIDLVAYGDFIEANRDVFFAWFNLDVIGDAAASKVNAEALKARGLAPIEVWHSGSSLEELAVLVAEDHAIIAIGGSVGMSEKKRAEVFAQVFERFPQQNFHFLGGSSKLLNVFDWFSADSTGWLACRKYGAVIDAEGQHKAPAEMNGIEAMARSCAYLSSLEAVAA